MTKQEWIRELISRELADDIAKDIGKDINQIEPNIKSDINTDITNELDNIKGDIAQILDIIHTLGTNINRIDSDISKQDDCLKSVKLELEKTNIRLNHIREFAVEQDNNIYDDLDVVKESVENNTTSIDKINNRLKRVKYMSENEPDNEDDVLIRRLTPGEVCFETLGNADKAKSLGNYYSRKANGESTGTTPLSYKFDELETMGYIPHFKQDIKTGRYKLDYFTFKPTL
jgi:hypothetical protein